MATLDNILIHGFYIYQQNTLIYNVPIIVFSEDGTLQHKIKIQGYKLDTANSDLPIEKRIKLLQGKELLQDVDFNVGINNTKDGIIITFFQNLKDVEIFECYRNTEANFFNSYAVNLQSTSLKQALETDVNKAGYILQEHDKLIKAIRGQVDTYSNEIIKRHKASEISFEPKLGLESENVQDVIEELKIDINEALSGTFQREAVEVATIGDIDLTNVSTIDGITLINGYRVLVKDQTNKAQNGVYSFAGNSLTRSSDMNTIKTIAGSQVRVKQGTHANTEWQCVVANILGILESESVIVEPVFNSIAENQVELKHLDKLPSKTLIGNNTNTEATPQAINFQDLPISDETQNALNFKTDNSDFLNFATQVQDILAEKQNILPIGGDNQVISWFNGQPENKTLTKDDVGLSNVDNTRDIDKIISNPQKEEFNKTFRTLGSLENLIDENDPNNNSLDLNNLINLKQGGYLIPKNIIELIDNKPANVTETDDAYLNIEIKENANGNNFLLMQIYVEQRNIQNQNTVDIKKYTINHYRIYNFTTGTFTEWTECATALDIVNIKQLLADLTLGDISGFYVSLDKHNADLLLKEDKLLTGLDTEYIRGDKTLQTFSTTHIIEGDQKFHTSDRVRSTTLAGYQTSNSETLETDTVLQALGKKADNLNVESFRGNGKPERMIQQNGFVNPSYTLTQNDSGRLIVFWLFLPEIIFPPIHTIASGSEFILRNETGNNITLIPNGNNIPFTILLPKETIMWRCDGGFIYRNLITQRHGLDMSKPISFLPNVNFTAPDHGFVVWKLIGGYANYCIIFVDGVEIYAMGDDINSFTRWSGGNIELGRGQTFKLQNDTSPMANVWETVVLTFYPKKVY